MPMGRRPRTWAASLLALTLLVSAGSPGSRTRLRGPRRAKNASSALPLAQPGAASREVVRWLPAPTSLDRRRLSDYAQLAKLAASDAAAGDYFGISVAIDGDTVVIGASGCWNCGHTGAVYVLRTSDGGATYV